VCSSDLNSADLNALKRDAVTNAKTLIRLEDRQTKVINFIDSQTNHPPIQWPDATTLIPQFTRQTINWTNSVNEVSWLPEQPMP
jgi:hypothetical protein